MAGLAIDAGLDPMTMELVNPDQYLPQKTPFFGIRQKEFPERRLVPRYDQIPVSEDEVNWKKWRKAVRRMMIMTVMSTRHIARRTRREEGVREAVTKGP